MNKIQNIKNSLLKRHIWLRDEFKLFEKRSPLSPSSAKVLLENNFKVTVEKSKTRYYKN
jgi:hypothetical protein